jgi:glycosyltransferase involved in cell wall biosynthesis
MKQATDKPLCSVIIRAYNEEEHIERLLRGILAQTVDDVEIILVDSGSTDDTVTIAEQYPVTIVHIAKEEFSFGRSLNMGCKAATGQFLVMASAHVYPVYDDWLASLLAPFDNPKVALTYGMQRGATTTQYSEHRVFARWFPDETSLIQTNPFCNNANAAIRRELWQQQPYDESLTGLEDIDWANRIISEGYYLAYAAEAVVIHIHDETPSQTYNRYRREAIAFKHIFPQETFTFWQFLSLWLLNTLSDYHHAWQNRHLLRNLVAIPRFRLMQFWGTYRGYVGTHPLTRSLRNTFYYPEQREVSDTSHRRDSASRIPYETFDSHPTD